MGEPGGPWSHGCEHYWERAAEGSKCGDCVDPTLTSSYPDTLAGGEPGAKRAGVGSAHILLGP